MAARKRLIHYLPTAAYEGVRGLELWADGGGHFNYLDDSEVHAVQQALRQYRLEACVLHAPYGSGYDLANIDPSEHQHALTAHRRAIEIAAQLNTRVVVVHPGGRYSPAELREDAFAMAADSLTKLAQWAERYNVILAVENMAPGAVGDRCGELLDLVTSVGSPHVRVCFDTGHAHVSGEGLIHALEVLAPHIAVVHWNDNDRSSDQHLPPGRGDINWSAFFQTLLTRAHPVYLSLEVRVPPNATLKGIIRSALSLIPQNAKVWM